MRQHEPPTLPNNHDNEPTMAASTAHKLGPYLRLSGISIEQLPAGASVALSANQHPSMTPANTAISHSSPLTLLTDILNEAIPFIASVAPASSAQPAPGALWKKRGSPRRFAASEAPVEVLSRVVRGADIDAAAGADARRASAGAGTGAPDETWVCRRSVHRDAAEAGTASWAEFVQGFKEHHAETERGFTESVVGAREAATWDVAPAAIMTTADGERWGRASLKLVEMKHELGPKPLRNRVFPVLQVAAEREAGREFIVVSIPISDMQRSPHAEYARDKSVVVASYVSVERIRKLPGNGDIEWIMAVASDAGGILPQWLQNLAVPRHIAHDVEWFLDWISRQRKEKRPVPIQRMSSTLDKKLPPAPLPSDAASSTTVPPPPISKTEGQKPPLARTDSMNKDLPDAPK